MSSVGIGDLCSVVRTKNAGPYLFSLDLVFKSQSQFQKIREAGVLTPESVAAAYRVPRESVVTFESNAQLLSVKATLKRNFAAGSPGDKDCFAMAQESPVLAIRVPLEYVEES
jgi:hypothetical protein